MKDITVHELERKALWLERIGSPNELIDVMRRAADHLANQPEELFLQMPLSAQTNVKMFLRGPATKQALSVLIDVLTTIANDAPDKVAALAAVEGHPQLAQEK